MVGGCELLPCTESLVPVFLASHRVLNNPPLALEDVIRKGNHTYRKIHQAARPAYPRQHAQHHTIHLFNTPLTTRFPHQFPQFRKVIFALEYDSAHHNIPTSSRTISTCAHPRASAHLVGTHQHGGWVFLDLLRQLHDITFATDPGSLPEPHRWYRPASAWEESALILGANALARRDCELRRVG